MAAAAKLPEPVTAALAAARRAPTDGAAWDRLEAVAAEHGCALAVEGAYREELQRDHGADAAMELGRRAVSFHQEWLADRPDALVEILRRVLEIDATADWALRRLIVALTLQERWDDVLGAYDRALAAVSERARRLALLEEAAQVAKDFAARPDRAIGYLNQLFAARPKDRQVVGALERLLERQERWEDLVSFWRARIDGVAPEEVPALRLRIATTELDRLAAPARALEETRRLLDDPGDDDTAAVDLAERLVALESAPAELRLEALRVVVACHDRRGRGERALAIIDRGLGFATGAARAGLHRESAARLVAGGAPREAARHLASLMALEPADRAVEDNLARLGIETGDHGQWARGLVGAAGSTPDGRRRVALLLAAADVNERLLGDDAAAIALYVRARHEDAADPAERLRALARLDALYERAGRDAERLEVLEARATLTERASERHDAWGAAARVAARIGALERAAAAWEKRLGADAADHEALDGLVDVLEAAKRWKPLIAALRRRMEAPVAAHQKRDDLQRIARIEATALGDPAGAVQRWTEHEQVFGPSVVGVDALVELLSSTDRWGELDALLAETAGRDRDRAAAITTRLGDACRLHLGAPARAAEWYARALVIDPAHAGARAGLTLLVEDRQSRAAAAAALVRAAGETDDWRLTLAMVEPRFDTAESAPARAEVLREAARIHEHRAGDRAAALAAVCRALPLVPEDAALEAEVLRLGEETGDALSIEAALAAAVAALPAGTRRRVELLARLGDVRRTRLNDPARALHAYREALGGQEQGHDGRRDLRPLVLRAAAEAGRWDVAAAALLAPACTRDERMHALVPLCEELAAAAGAFGPLAAAVTAALPAATHLPPEAACEIEHRLAAWHEGRLGDAAAAEAALLRARARIATDLPTLRRLAELRRRAPAEPLYETLLEIAALTTDDVDALYEAIGVARAVPLDAERTLGTAERLFDRAGRLLRVGARPSGVRTAEEAALLAVDTLVALLSARGRTDDLSRAVAVLREGAGLPVGAETARGMRRAAARLAEERLEDAPLAVAIRHPLFVEDPDDADNAEALARLYAALDRLAELVELRHRQLSRATDPERRLALRLEIERLGAIAEQRSERVALLRANLGERPGHPATVNAIADVLTAKGRLGELADVFEEQATKVEAAGDADAAARLYTRFAETAEAGLRDRRRALTGHERAAALVPAAPTLDALGRLYMEEKDAEAAARWLDRRLALAGPAEAPPIAVRLARAYIASARRHRAIACLERALGDAPAATEARTLLADIYRGASSWEPLARLCADATAHIADREGLLAAAREAHVLYRDRLGTLAPAIPALERAVAVAPDDAELSLALGLALREVGRLDEAWALLSRMLGAARRSPERAVLHRELGRVAHAQGNLAVALAELEKAAAIDMESPHILRLLGDVAREAGQTERAERAFRGLLMLLRRPEVRAAAQRDGRVAGGAVGEAASAVLTLLALHELAAARGDTGAAAELLESAFEAAAGDRAEFARLRDRLGDRGELGALGAALDKRVAAAKTPAERADACRELAEVRTRQGDREGAVEALLGAVGALPEDADLHARAREAAREAGLVERYLTVLEAAIENRRRRNDGAVVVSLLLRTGELIETELGDAARALGAYKRAAELDERPAEVATALARAAANNDPAEHRRALDRLVRLAKGAQSPEEHADALYRLAEARLAAADTREDGLRALSEAVEKVRDLPRALGIVKQAVVASDELHKVLPLYEHLARSSGDERMLLDCLGHQAAAQGATLDVAREGYDLALALDDDDAADRFLGRLVDIGRTLPGGGAAADVSWGIVERAKRRRAAGDLAGAHAHLAEALQLGDGAPVRASLAELLGDLAAQARRQGDLRLAASIYETLRRTSPADQQLWQTLFDLYVEAGDRAALPALVSETLQQLVDPRERNQVRMRYVQALVGDTDGDDAVDVLRDMLMDEPEHDQAAMLLADVYERQGEVGLLGELLDTRRHVLADRGDRDGAVLVAQRLARLVAADRPELAVDVLGWALALAPGDATLVQAVLALLPEDSTDPRARAVEELLASQPGQADIRTAREARYRAAGMWDALAQLLVEAAEHEGEPAGAAARLIEAATIQRTRLFDAASAVELLRQARKTTPNDVDIVRQLADALIELGEPKRALQETLTACRTVGLPHEVRARLLRLHADLLVEQGERDAAVSILLEAVAYSKPSAKPELMAIVDRLRAPSPEAVPEEMPTVDTDELEVVSESSQQ